jgi:alpha-ketoglutarate-dependent 2,4-dichlorophenoxyacetate dioxygenase
MVQAQLKPRRAEHDWPFQVTPLHLALGCEIKGITLEQAVSPAMFAKVHEAFLEYELILFRDVDLPPALQVAFAKNFGEVNVHVLSQYHGYGHPEIYMLSNKDENGRPSGKHPDRGTLYWHTDGSWRDRTGQATMMYSEELPPPGKGGETQFADMYAGYEMLPADIKKKIEGKNAIHNFTFSRQRRHGEDPLTAAQSAKVPPVAHPIVRTHPETGRKALCLGNHATHIVGVPQIESAAILAELLQHATQRRFVYTHRWRPGDLVVWDNRVLLHRLVLGDTLHRHRRIMHRSVVAGTVPF